MSAGARFSRTVPPRIGGAVMTRSSVSGRVQEIDLEAQRALVSFGDASRWIDFAQLYDASGLLWFPIALELLRAGTRLEYVVPGCAPFAVADLSEDGFPHVVLIGGGVVCLDRRAPRFLVVR